MKKFIMALGIILLSTSCNNSSPDLVVTKIEYSGHSYIIFDSGYGYGCEVVHDPDCECMIDYD